MARPCSAPQRSDRNWNPDNDTNTYPCSPGITSDTLVPPAANAVFIFDRVYVEKRGWVVVLFLSTLRTCAQPPCAPAGANAPHAYDWQVQHVRTASTAQDSTNNYNVPNDAHMWELGELMFGGVAGVGVCAKRCPLSTEYDNVRGTIKWKPKLTLPVVSGLQQQSAEPSQYWLYSVFRG